MVDINEIYQTQSEYLKADDIGNQMWTVTIATADVKKFTGQNGEESKIVLTFHELDKTMPLNITNARAIAEMYGHNSNDWLNRQIMLMTMPVKYQDKMVNAIRVRAPQAPVQPQQPAPVQPYRPGAPQQQAATRMGVAQNSPQRPLNPPQQGYAQQSGGQTLSDDDIPF